MRVAELVATKVEEAARQGDAGRHHGLPEPGLVEGDLLLAQRVVISGEEVLEVAGHRPGIAGGEGAVGDDVLCVLAQRLVVVPECLRKGQQEDRVEKTLDKDGVSERIPGHSAICHGKLSTMRA